MTQILGFIFAGASAVTGLAMLLLVVWQAPRHRHNRLMALYLATLVAWGASNIAARLCALLGWPSTTFVHGAVFGNGLNSLVLFWFVTDYVEIRDRRWVRLLCAAGVVWVVVGAIGLFAGRLMIDATVTPDGMFRYRVSPYGVAAFLIGDVIYLAALGCLWVYRRGRAGALLPGGLVLVAGQIGTLVLLPFLHGVPPITIAFTAIASVCFTYSILREHLFNPLARSEASLTVLLENTADPVWSVDVHRRLTTFNTAFRQLAVALSGITPTAGMDALELLPADARPFWSRLYERALRGERVSVERQFAMPGVPTHLEISFNPIVAGEATPSGVAVFARDVTAHARVVAEQSRAREAAEDASRAKSQFLASVSHELRTPLNAVLGFAQLLSDRADGTLTARQGEFVESILTAGRHLLALINDLIDLSKIEAGKLDLAADRFQLGDQVAEAVRLLAPAADAKGLELIFDIADGVPDALVGDPRRLRQILVNLVGNAVKFTERGHVLVRVEPDAETYGGVRLRFDVADTGVGIPAAQLTRLFEPFVHGHARTAHAQEGIGLGLLITRRLAEAMGGSLGVESESGSGSVFSCTLPFRLAPGAPTVKGVDLAGTSVLVVDGNEILRAVLGRWLTAWRARPTLVADGDTARAALERARVAGTPFRLLLVGGRTEGSGALIADLPHGTVGGVVVLLPPTGEAGAEALSTDRVVGVRKPVGPDQLRAALGAALAGLRDAVPVAPHSRRTARPLRVLVAEDSLTNLAIASALLERWGHTVTRAGNGRDAVAEVHAGVYDLVLMDVQMPGIDGLEATRLIRDAERTTTRRVPIVAMTASAMKGDRERCLEAGMDGYLAKPLDADELFEMVERFAAPALAVGDPPTARERFPDGADAATIVERLDGDHVAARDMGQLFLVEYPRCVLDLRAALEAGDPEGVSRAARALKGSIGLFSAVGHDAAQRLEVIGHQGALADAAGALELLERELARLLPTIHELADGEARLAEPPTIEGPGPAPRT